MLKVEGIDWTGVGFNGNGFPRGLRLPRWLRVLRVLRGVKDDNVRKLIFVEFNVGL